MTSIIDETLTRRPYVKHLATFLLNGNYLQTVDGAKLARESLKNLTSEDFMQLYHMEGAQMAEYERLYPNIQGAQLENELAKITLRYQNEGRPAGYNARKQVTFQEGSYDYNQENQI